MNRLLVIHFTNNYVKLNENIISGAAFLFQQLNSRIHLYHSLDNLFCPKITMQHFGEFDAVFLLMVFQQRGKDTRQG